MSAPWTEVELTLSAVRQVQDPYLEIEAWADFEHPDGTVLRRPAFFDGGQTWRVRFAAPHAGQWRWRTGALSRNGGPFGR